MRIAFVRHGQSVANVSGRWQGHGDAPLSPHGRLQAKKLGARLASRFDRAVSSDLMRAIDTARALGVPLEMDPGFREIDVGQWEGLTRQEVLERFPDEIAAIFRGEDVTIGGGESWAMATARAESALARLREASRADERIAVVCHGGIISSLFLRFLGVRARRPQPVGRMVNTAISEVHFDGDRIVVERYNDALHTAPEGAWARSEFGPNDTIITYVAWPEHKAFAGFDDATLARDAFAGITHVYAGADGGVQDLARGVAELAGAHLEAGEISLDATPRDGKCIAVVTSPEAVHALAQGIVDPYADHAILGIPAVGSVTHVAKTQSVNLLADFNIGPIAGAG